MKFRGVSPYRGIRKSSRYFKSILDGKACIHEITFRITLIAKATVDMLATGKIMLFNAPVFHRRLP